MVKVMECLITKYGQSQLERIEEWLDNWMESREGYFYEPIIWDQIAYQGRDIKDLNWEEDLMINKEDTTMIEAVPWVIQDKVMEKTLEVSQKIVKEIKEDSLSLKKAVVKENTNKTYKDEKMMIDQGPEIAGMENMNIALDVNAKIVSIWGEFPKHRP